MSEQDGSSWPPADPAAPSPYAAPTPATPYGTPPPPSASPYGTPQPSASPYGTPPPPSASPYGTPQPSASPYGAPESPAPSASPYGSPPPSASPYETRRTPSPAASPYGTSEPPASPYGTTEPPASPYGTDSSPGPDGTPPPPTSPYDAPGTAPGSRAERRRGASGGARGRLPHVPRGVMVAGAVVAAAAAARGTAMLTADDDGDELSATAGEATKGTALDSASRAAGEASAAPAAAALALPAGLDVDHLLRRVTYGVTDALRAEVRKQGAAVWLARQLDPANLPDPDGDAVAALFPQLRLTPAAAEKAVTDRWAFQRDLAAAHLGRAIWSSRQLFEVMVGFWSDHFNIPCPGERAQLTRHGFDADVIRRGALGRFEDLLQASAIHPAMLDYLDNGVSTGPAPNENYARALLEHHTVGPACAFTEADVRQAALLLTGFQVKDHSPRFVASLHHTGSVTVLGFTHRNDSKEGGRNAAAALLQHLARHPATAAHLARKLAVRFVADDPPAALVDRLAKAYLAADTRIVPVLTALLTSPEFAASAGHKLRRPMERLTATVRALGIGPGKDAQPLVQLHWMLGRAGHAPLGCPRPEGYPDVASAWRSPVAALAHFNSSARLAHGWWPQGLANPGPGRLLRVQPTTRAAAVEAVGTRLLGRALTAPERAAATALLAATKLPVKFAAGTWEQKETIGLVATLLLNSPAYLVR